MVVGVMDCRIQRVVGARAPDFLSPIFYGLKPSFLSTSTYGQTAAIDIFCPLLKQKYPSKLLDRQFLNLLSTVGRAFTSIPFVLVYRIYPLNLIFQLNVRFKSNRKMSS